jgi:hypothetical protein
MAQVVERLLGKHKALSPNPYLYKKKKKNTDSLQAQQVSFLHSSNFLTFPFVIL